MTERLIDLHPKTEPAHAGIDGRFTFTCPLCRKGVINVWVVLGGEPRNGAHVANILPPEWDRMTVRPSIAAEGKCSRTNRGCPGWHGHIVTGAVTP